MHDDDGWVENEGSSKIRSGWEKKEPGENRMMKVQILIFSTRKKPPFLLKREAC
jgi:hypothetical protein